MSPTLTMAQARRIALAAQGFADPVPAEGSVGMRGIQRVVDRVQVVQIDSVNVLTRSHYLPFYSRLGPYDPALLDRARDGAGPRSRAPRRLVEYWAHEASLIPPATWPYLGFRMRRAHYEDSWGRRVAAEHPGILEAVLEQVRTYGPMTARQVESRVAHDVPRSKDNWGWNWSLVKNCLEHLFWAGRITSAGRTAQFERRYADLCWALPPDVAARAPGTAQAPTDEESALELMRRSVRAHGIGTELCLRDYFRLRPAVARGALAELTRLGEIEAVTIRGWARPAYLDPAARRPRRIQARALLSPFDSLIWQRGRTEALFGFRYRLEIYVPAAKRVHGYYVLPFLWDERLVGRVDLKADRAADRLWVRAVHLEGDAPSGAQEALGQELARMARWLELGRVDRH